MQIKYYIKLIRPSNWIKNILVFLPLILSGIKNLHDFYKTLIGFICFSFIASGGYILNDIRDIEKDRMHIKKKFRPLAYYNVDLGKAIFLSIGLVTFGLVISFFLGRAPFYVAIIYFFLNYFYSIRGKEIRFIDIILLSTFYIIRVIYGAEICDVPLTGWFVAAITMSVLSLSINKRYMESKMSNTHKISGRSYTKDDLDFLQVLMINFALGAIILLNIHAYFILNIKSAYFYFFINISSAGIIFYYFDYSKNKSDDPVERILKNKPLFVLLVFFILTYVYEVLRHYS